MEGGVTLTHNTMNHLAIVRKHLRGLESAYGQITGVDTKRKAREELSDAYFRIIGPVVGETATVDSATTITATIDGIATPAQLLPDMPVKAAETPEAAIPAAPILAYTPAASLETPSVPEVVGDLPGQTGTFYPETAVADQSPVPVAVPSVDGWPVEAKLTVIGLSANRRHLKGRVWTEEGGDSGRLVCMERNLGAWKVGDAVKAKLIRAGANPLYRMVE